MKASVAKLTRVEKNECGPVEASVTNHNIIKEQLKRISTPKIFGRVNPPSGVATGRGGVGTTTPPLSLK